ncbi:DUF2156 domain-containing protein [Thermodesulfobacteriota bacterium]
MDEFKLLELSDKPIFTGALSQDPPQASELTFTNLFMWGHRRQVMWAVKEDCLLLIVKPVEGRPYALQPVGSGDKAAALDFLCRSLKDLSPEAEIHRVDKGFVETQVDPNRFRIIEDRDNSDYVYLCQDLIRLSGRKYHKKKNHLNRFIKNYRFEYRELDAQLVESVLNMQETWCELRDCDSNPGLFDENRAIFLALKHYDELKYTGGAIVIDGRVEAFALGELLNPDTAVVHVEKASPEIPGLYAAINQRFCQEAWANTTFINREQDLGVEGLRAAKQSYHPNHLIEKFTLVCSR